MLFLSAQPDDFYFSWQLELQIYNFNKLGVSSENIHVLLGYNPIRGLRHFYPELIDKYKDKASFFAYPDERGKPKYPSSIRPHIIQQHLKGFPELQNESIFYHDSDIIFRELPDFKKMSSDDVWYVSDTRNYLDSRYIKRVGGGELFNQMCQTIGISPELVEASDENCGGAQYLIKMAPLAFWQKVESDCERLYDLLETFNYQKAEDLYVREGKRRSQSHGIQSWCTDMWVVLWNAILFGFEIKLHKDLDFCWPMNDIKDWHNKTILHYSGSFDKKETKYFNKSRFSRSSPFYNDTLEKIPQDNCSYPLVKAILEVRDVFDQERIDLKLVSFLIPIRVDSESRLVNLLYVIRYLVKHFFTNILIIESDKAPKVDASSFPSGVDYSFVYDENPILHRTHINNALIQKSKTPFIALHDSDVIIPVNQIIKATDAIRSGLFHLSYPYDGSFLGIDNRFKTLFGKVLDDELLQVNKNKFIAATSRSYGGAVFIDKGTYLKAGLENEYFKGWGPEDLERQKRMRNLGYKVKRIKGALFHLPHSRFENSSYESDDRRVEYMNEYLKISRMHKKELSAYVGSWEWIKNI